MGIAELSTSFSGHRSVGVRDTGGGARRHSTWDRAVEVLMFTSREVPRIDRED